MLQTLAPTDLRVEALSPTSVRLPWQPVNYQPERLDAAGGYFILELDPAAGSIRRVATLRSKGRSRMVIDRLEPGSSHELAIRTYSDPHRFNRNRVASGVSEVVAVELPMP